MWLKRQLLAESSIENREELLLESAEQLETDLNLLGKRSDTRTAASASEKAHVTLLFSACVQAARGS